MLYFYKNNSFTTKFTILRPFWHQAGPVAEQSRAEPSRAGPGRVEPSRAEPSRAGPSRATPSRAEPGQAEPSRAEPVRADPLPSRAEPGRAGPGRADMGWYGVLYINFPPPPVFYFDFLGQVLVWHGNLQTHILDFFVAVTGQKGNRERANINGPLPYHEAGAHPRTHHWTSADCG